MCISSYDKDENIVLFKTVEEAKGWLGLSCI
jgi:hypothetical protein